MSSKEDSIAQILSVLENKSTKGNDRLNCYTTITKKFKEDGAKTCGDSIVENISRILSVIQLDVVSSTGNVAQAALEVLGVCLHDLEIVRSVSEDEGKAVIRSLCECIVKTGDKNTCTRAMWCVGKQNLPDKLIQKQVEPILQVVEQALETWKGQSVTVEHESVNTIARLTEQAPGEMSKEAARWGKLLLPFVSHSAVKVRDHVLTVSESALPLMETQRKELVTGLLPVFKTKVLPELKKLFNSKHELYVLKCWAMLVQLFDEELHHGSFINHMLPVVEMGFKSMSPEVKVESFRAWQQLIDNFAQNPNILGDPKRIKLIMQVFKLNNAKTEPVAEVKLKVWWHFIWMLGNKISTNFDMVAVPFLQFCVGGSKLVEHQNGGTPRATLKVGVASPATPRMNLTVGGGASQWAVFKSLQMCGAEALALMLGLPDLAEFDHHFKLDTLRFEVVTGPSFFIKHSAVFITTATELITNLGQELPESLVLHIWHWLIAHLKNAIDSPLKLDIRETLNTLMTHFQIVILSRVLASSLLLRMLQGLCQLPRKVLCSTAYSIKGEKTVNGTPALFLMELLLTPALLESCSNVEMYHELFASIVTTGGQGNATCTLGFLQAVFETLGRNRDFVEDKETLWRLWSATVSPLLENISSTSEVNQGDALEPNFDCTILALTFPAVGKLHAMPAPSVKTLIKTWRDLYKTVDRLAAMVTNAEANVICENVCHKLLDCVRAEENMEADSVDMYVQFCQVVVSGLDFSSLDTQSAFNLGYSPKKVHMKRQKPLENIHSLASLLARLQDAAIHLASAGDINKKPSGVPLQGIFNTLVDVFSTLFSHVSSSFVITNMIVLLAQPLSSLFGESARKTSAKVYNNAFQQKLEKLWLDICTCLQSRYTSMYDSDFLKKLSPLLESTFLHSRRQIKNQTLALWSSTFAKSALLEYPEDLRPVLSKVKEKNSIQLPGWVPMSSPVIQETPVSQMSMSQAPEPKLPGMPSPHKIHGSFLHKAVSPNVKRSPLKSPGSPRPVPKANSAKKKVLGWDSGEKDFVVIKSSPRKKMALTEHQRETMKERRVFPAMYNTLEISQDVSMMASHLGGDTQHSDTPTPTPTPTFTQPFSLFGSMVPPTAEQQKSDSQKSTQPSNEENSKKRKDVLSSPEEDGAKKTKCRRSVRFRDKVESSQDSLSQKIPADSDKQADVIVTDDSKKNETDIPAAVKEKTNTVDLTKDSQEPSSKESSDRDSSSAKSIPQNVLGVVGFSQLTSSRSSQSKSSKSSEESDSPMDTDTDKAVVETGINDKASDILDTFGSKEVSDDEAGITLSEPLLSWTQKLNELSQSPGLKSPTRKALSQDSRSPKRTGSPHRSPKRTKKKLTNENVGVGALDKWILRSPVKTSNISQKLSQDIIVASVNSVTATFVEETQSPSKFKDIGKATEDKTASIMETPPKNVLEDLSVSHGNSSRKLFNSQNNLGEIDMMEDSNMIPASPNSKSFTVKTGSPILKVKRLTEEEIRRYSPSRVKDPEEAGTPGSRAEKHKVRCNLNLETTEVSHEHDDFSVFKPLGSESVTQIEQSYKGITDSEQVMVNHLNKVETAETPSLFTQETQPDIANVKPDVKDSELESASQDSQEESSTENTNVKVRRKSRARKQETPIKNLKSPEEKKGRRKKSEEVATKDSKKSDVVATKDGKKSDVVATKDSKKSDIVATKDSKKSDLVATKESKKSDLIAIKDSKKKSDVATKESKQKSDVVATKVNKKNSNSKEVATKDSKKPDVASKASQKSDVVATKVSKRIQKKKEKAAGSQSEDIEESKSNDICVSQDIFDNTQNNNLNSATDIHKESNKIIEEKSDVNEMEEMDVELTPVGIALDGTEIMEVEEEVANVKINEANVENATEDEKQLNKKDVGKKKAKSKGDIGTQELETKQSDDFKGSQNDIKQSQSDEKCKKEEFLTLANQNTPDTKISSNQPERRSTTKHKKEVAQKMTLKRSKDTTVVNDSDSNLDVDLSDEDIPLKHVKKIVGENLEKKMENLKDSDFSMEKDNTCSENMKENIITVTLESQENKEDEKMLNEENDNAKQDLNVSFVSDDDVPLVAIKDKLVKKEKKKRKSSQVLKNGSPVGSKLRSNNVKVSRLRSAEKKVKISPKSKKSVKLAVKRANSVEAKKKLISADDTVENDKADIDIETEQVTQSEEAFKLNTLDTANNDEVIKDRPELEQIVDNATATVENADTTFENAVSTAIKETLNTETVPSSNLDETPKKGFEQSNKSSLTAVVAYSDSKLILGSRKFERKLGFARRSILKSSGLATSEGVGSPKRRDFHPITVARIYSPTASPSASILKKRRLTEDSGSETNSPPAKLRRVSFAEPLEAESQIQEAMQPSPLVKGADKPLPSTPTSSLRWDSQSTVATQSPAGYQSTQESQLDTTEPVYPGLKTCDQAVEKVLPQLTSSIWSRGLGQLMRARNIQTIGDLCTLTEVDIQSLPIKSPKVATVRKVLDKFSKNQKAKAVKLWGPGKLELGSGKIKEGNTDVKNSPSSKPVPEVEVVQETNSKGLTDNEVSQTDIDAILASSGTLLDEVNKLSQTMSQSQSQDIPCDTAASQSKDVNLSQAGSEPPTSQEISGSQFLDTLKSLNAKESDILKGLRVDELFQVHQYLTSIQTQVVDTLKTRCHSPSNNKHRDKDPPLATTNTETKSLS